MKWKAWLLIFVFGVISAGVLFFFNETLQKSGPSGAPSDTTAADVSPKPSAQSQPLVSFIDPTRGNDKARNTIIVYADYVCPACKGLNADIDQLMKDRGDTVKLVWKNLPNAHYPGASLAAEAALCAKAQNHFWDYHAKLFDENALNEVELTLIATNLGLDTNAFSSCLGNHETKPIVNRTIDEAVALGIDATPYLFINGKRYSGQMSYDQLVQAISP